MIVDLDFVRDLSPHDLELVDSRHFPPGLKRRESELGDGVPLQTVIRYTGLTEEELAREMKKDSGV